MITGSAAPSPPVLFSCLRFRNSADPAILEPGTGYRGMKYRGRDRRTTHISSLHKMLTLYVSMRGRHHTKAALAVAISYKLAVTRPTHDINDVFTTMEMFPTLFKK